MGTRWQNARAYLGRHGLGRTLIRAVTATVYRRLVLFEIPLDELGAGFGARIPFDLAPLRPEDVDEMIAARPELEAAETRRRLARGDGCAVGRSDERIVYQCWWSNRPIPIPYLGSPIPMEAGDVYVFDAWVHPDLRRKRIGLAAIAPMVREWQSAGSRRLIGTIEPENLAAFATHEFLPVRYRGRIDSIGIGRARVAFRRRRVTRPAG